MLQYNTTLVFLNLENNKLKQESGKVIALAMNQNTTLCHLKLAGNKHNRSVLSQDDIMNFHARTKLNVCPFSSFSFSSFFPFLHTLTD